MDFNADQHGKGKVNFKYVLDRAENYYIEKNTDNSYE